MNHLVIFALRSAWNRRLTLCLVILTVALSVAMLLGVERIRDNAQHSFAQSVSGTDLIVGARTSQVQLMLYAIFRMGDPTNTISWDSVEKLQQQPAVDWVVPLSLGDSYRGFSVLGTSVSYFEHFRYGDKKSLELTSGDVFASLFETVIGAEVADKLGLKLGDRIALNHGLHEIGNSTHDDKPFTVVGVLRRTGTPVDRTVHVSLAAIEAIHLDWRGGARLPGFQVPAQYVEKFDLTPKQVTAALVGLKSRAGVFRVQRWVNEYTGEPLLAVLPGVALSQLWQMIGVVEKSLLFITALVVIVGLCGLVAVVLAGLNERRRELAILRSVGAQPKDIFVLLTLEGLMLTLLGTVAGWLALTLASMALGPWLQSTYGVALSSALISQREAILLAMVVGVGLIASLLPGYRAYRHSLIDGLTPRV